MAIVLMRLFRFAFFSFEELKLLNFVVALASVEMKTSNSEMTKFSLLFQNLVRCFIMFSPISIDVASLFQDVVIEVALNEQLTLESDKNLVCLKKKKKRKKKKKN